MMEEYGYDPMMDWFSEWRWNRVDHRLPRVFRKTAGTPIYKH
ncbi:hypothetical protein NSS89_04970 [Caldifermentibacillus hisashii]|nr:hypothetical protein [Caldibacillus thermoamylovorans]